MQDFSDDLVTVITDWTEERLTKDNHSKGVAKQILEILAFRVCSIFSFLLGEVVVFFFVMFLFSFFFFLPLSSFINSLFDQNAQRTAVRKSFADAMETKV